MKNLILLLGLLILLGCSDEGDPNTGTIDTPNILLIIADDLGKDALSGFDEGSIKPSTPNLDELRNDGLSFNNFWVYPTCSPTRASMISGKYGYRTGVKWAGDELSQDEQILQDYINEKSNNSYATAIVGKWHLSSENSTLNPESLGMDYYVGLIRGGVQDYFNWQKTEDGNTSLQTEYTTKEFTDLSIDWINGQSKPWFLWLAYNAPHTPFHVPPSEMHSQGDLPEYTNSSDPLPYYLAAIEAMDYQIGQLLDNIPKDELDNTVIIFMGDNGTPNQVAQFPYTNNTAKGSLYQGGINVPMFVTGKEVSRKGEDNNLICSADIFSTIAELSGIENADIHDSKSFKNLLSEATDHRNFQYSEMNNGTDDLWTISNGEYKLIINMNGTEEMYHLSSDSYENDNLLSGMLTMEQQNIKTELELELLKIRN